MKINKGRGIYYVLQATGYRLCVYDCKTARLHDCKTARLHDCKTARLHDSKTFFYYFLTSILLSSVMFWIFE
jgi:hypothetical protein